MGRISILSDEVIDKIAAGEVVESPGAVIKELVENALDAKATRIAIEIKNGGQLLIRVDDNGVGMDREDALMALKRHATSKISSHEDLFALHTMGFRGEALASIAAVSKLTLKTRCEDGEPTALYAEGGQLLNVETSPREKGTWIEVRSLFYNTPARKSFLKSTSASSAEIIRMVMALALANPAIHFELFSQEENVLKALKIETEDRERLLGFRVKTVLGDSFFSQASWVFSEEGPYQIYGFLGKPGFVRQNRLGQYLFINQRWIQSPALSAILREAYGTHIKEGSHPHFVLHFTIPKEHVDVNVHPQKREVRLKEVDFLKKLIAKTTGQLFHSASLPSLSLPTSSYALSSYSFRQENPWEKSAFEQRKFEGDELPWERREQLRPEQMQMLVPETSSKSLEVIFLTSPFLLAKGKIREGKVATEEEGILAFDLKGAYARVLFEKVTASLLQKQGEAHALLIPLTLTVSRDLLFRLKEASAWMEKIGLEVRLLGEEMVAIDSYPSFVREKDVPDFFLDLLEEQPKVFSENSRRLASFTSRFARSRREPFYKEEAKALAENLLQSKTPFICPLGRPVILSLGEQEWEKFFSGKGGFGCE